MELCFKSFDRVLDFSFWIIASYPMTRKEDSYDIR